MKTLYKFQELVETYRLEKSFVTHCLRCHWISLATPNELEFDDEDLARLLLIRDLTRDLGVNDESVPIILHLLDQLHQLRRTHRSDQAA